VPRALLRQQSCAPASELLRWPPVAPPHRPAIGRAERRPSSAAVGTSVTGPGGRAVDVVVDNAAKSLCVGQRPDGGAITGAGCIPLPLQIDAIPFTTTTTNGVLSVNAVVPDTVTSVTATNVNDVTRSATPGTNIAFVMMPDDAAIKHVGWTTSDGKTYGQDIPGGTE
jgi:hypothetical protein